MSYSSSFGSAGFDVLTSGMAEEYSDDKTTLHIPGGSINYVDAAGAGPVTRKYAIYFTSYADWSAFAALRNTTATLTVPWGTWTALMSNPRITSMNPTLSAIQASAEFLTT